MDYEPLIHVSVCIKIRYLKSYKDKEKGKRNKEKGKRKKEKGVWYIRYVYRFERYYNPWIRSQWYYSDRMSE